MPTPKPSVNELIAVLQRSSLPTVVVEGDDDIVIYRWLGAQIRVDKLGLLQCYGRSNLLELFGRRSEFSNTPVVFVADRDMWLFTQVPKEFDEVVWTTGYSVENDVLAGSLVERMLEPSEHVDYNTSVHEISRWFAFEIEQFRAGRDAHVGHEASDLLVPGGTALDPTLLKRRGFRDPDAGLVREVVKEYRLWLRGKTLLSLLVRFLSAPKRPTQYGRRSVLELSTKLTDGHKYCGRLVELIGNKLETEIARTGRRVAPTLEV